MTKLCVEWESPPDDWMMPAAIIFQRALHECSGAYSGNEEMVIHISVFPESVRPAGFHGAELPSLADANMELVASPMIHVIPRRPVVQTKLGDTLMKRKLVGVTVGAVTAVTVAITILDPGSTNVEDLETGLSIIKRNPVTMMIESALIFGNLFVVGHLTSRQLLKMSFQNFFCLLMLLYSGTARAISVYDGLTVLHSSASLSWWFIFVRVLHGIGVFLVSAVLGTIDAVLIGIRAKAVITLCRTIEMAYRYMSYSSGQHLSPICPWGIRCMQPQAVHSSALAGQFMLTMRLLLSYVAGYKYVALQPVYIDPHWRGLRSLVSRISRYVSGSSSRNEVQAVSTVCKFSVDSDLQQVRATMSQTCSSSSPSLDIRMSLSEDDVAEEKRDKAATAIVPDIRATMDYQFR